LNSFKIKLKLIIYLVKVQEYEFNHCKMELREILSKIILYNHEASKSSTALEAH